MIYWNDIAKRLLKSELVKRGINNADLATLLTDMGVEETKASIDSKISRGSFSACFLIQCLTAIGCSSLEIGSLTSNFSNTTDIIETFNIITNEK